MQPATIAMPVQPVPVPLPVPQPSIPQSVPAVKQVAPAKPLLSEPPPPFANQACHYHHCYSVKITAE